MKTLQTTTVAAQASVSRKDMSVVTAVRNVSSLYADNDGGCMVTPFPFFPEVCSFVGRNTFASDRSDHNVCDT